jgi:hypothetical protein
VRKAEETIKVRDYAREIDSESDDGHNFGNVLAATGTGAGGGALIGAGVGGLAGQGYLSWLSAPLGALLGALIGGVGGLITGLVGTSSTGAAVAPET